MTDQPTRRIAKPRSGRSDNEAVPTQRIYSRYPEREMQKPAGARGGESERTTQANALAWSEDERRVRPEPREYYDDAYGTHPRPLPDERVPADEYSDDETAHGAPWYRRPAPYLAAAALAAVILAGGGLAYTLTGSSHHIAPPHPRSVVPTDPQQNQFAPPPVVSPPPDASLPQPLPAENLPPVGDQSGPADGQAPLAGQAPAGQAPAGQAPPAAQAPAGQAPPASQAPAAGQNHCVAGIPATCGH
jgi:hypothetical protein